MWEAREGATRLRARGTAGAKALGKMDGRTDTRQSQGPPPRPQVTGGAQNAHVRGNEAKEKLKATTRRRR